MRKKNNHSSHSRIQVFLEQSYVEFIKEGKEKFLREEKVGVKEGEIPKPNNFPLQESRA